MNDLNEFFLMQETKEEHQEMSDKYPTEHKRDTDPTQTSAENPGQQHPTSDPVGERPIRATTAGGGAQTPEVTPTVTRDARETQETTDSSVRHVTTPLTSVSVQTEDSDPPGPATHLLCAHTQTREQGEGEGEDSPPVCSVPPPQRTETQDALLFSGTFPIPADPARLAERIRRNRTQLSAAFDDTEYEPYGLPEVVMKGDSISR